MASLAWAIPRFNFSKLLSPSYSVSCVKIPFLPNHRIHYHYTHPKSNFTTQMWQDMMFRNYTVSYLGYYKTI